MKLIDNIQKNQIEVLNQMGLGIEKFETTYSFQYGIVYKIDITNIHISIFYDWKNNKVSLQFFFEDKYKQISKECFNSDELHSIVINEIYANI